MNKRLLTTTLAFLFLLHMIVLFISCSKISPKPKGNTCDGIEMKQEYFRVLSYNLSYITPSNLTAVNSILYPYDSIYVSVKATQTEKVALLKQKLSPSFSFFSAAYACSPLPALPISPVTSIKIVNKSKVIYHHNDTLLVGDTINSKFLFREVWSTNLIPLTSITVPGQSVNFDLRLKDKPYMQVKVNFDVIIKQKDGKEFILPDNSLLVK